MEGNGAKESLSMKPRNSHISAGGSVPCTEVSVLLFCFLFFQFFTPEFSPICDPIPEI